MRGSLKWLLYWNLRRGGGESMSELLTGWLAGLTDKKTMWKLMNQTIFFFITQWGTNHCCRTKSIDDDNCDLWWYISLILSGTWPSTSTSSPPCARISYEMSLAFLTRWPIANYESHTSPRHLQHFLILRKTQKRFNVFISSYVFSSLNTLKE